MRLAQHSRVKAEGLAIWLILLAILGGAVWFVYSSRTDGQKNARKFADEVIQKVVVEYDEKFLDLRLSTPARANYSAMWRAKMFRYLREFGQLSKPVETTGTVSFTSHFYDPRGMFQSKLTYPTMTARFEVIVSRSMTNWQIDQIDLIWNPPPTPSPTPGPSLTPSPTPSPTPAQKAKRKKGRG